MASLRRVASLGTAPCSSSNPAYCTNRLTRHSSLPNLFLCQPELFMKALSRPSPASRKFVRQSFPFRIDSPSLHALSLCSKHPLCRALSSHSFDELPHFYIPTEDACDLFAWPTDTCVGHPSHVFQSPSRGFQKSPRKEALLAVGKQSLDMEKSIVYTELKESMWKFAAPPRFLKPGDIEGNPCPAIHTHIHTHIHDAPKPMKNRDLCIESRRNDVKGRPLSLRLLKRKLSQTTPPVAYNMQPCGLSSSKSKQLDQIYPLQAESNHNSKLKDFSDAYDSVSSAFASMFYIMNMLQQYTQSLRMQSRSSIFESDRSSCENLVGRACTEMLDSFLWLFQQVFCRTPRLMLLTMVLLADFTLHSMSMHVAFPVMPLGEPPTPTIFPRNIKESPVRDAAGTDAPEIYRHGPEEACKVWIAPSKNSEEHLHGAHSGGGGNGGHARTRYGGRDAKEPRGLQITTTADGRAIDNGDFTASSSSLLHHVHEKPSECFSHLKEIDLDVSMKHLLVAPVRAPTLEADNYPCFDRTDLAYQHEISMDPSNPLLLANYAQFLHLVRHDYGRAEELYKKAMSAEAEVDGDVMGRFASFLWVAKKDVAEADRAFKAATAADPTNAFHAGNYAHFLWNCQA